MADDASNEANEKEIVRTWRAWRTVHEMVYDRVCFCMCNYIVVLAASSTMAFFLCFPVAFPEQPRRQLLRSIGGWADVLRLMRLLGIRAV